MNSDLLFHIVSRRKWKDLNIRGQYNPEEYINENEIECVTAEYLNEYLNEKFSGRKNLLILVIEKSRLINGIRTDTEKKKVYVKNYINIDAILDKIRIDAGKEGKFDLKVTTE